MESNFLLVEPNDILRSGLSCALAERRHIRRITEMTNPTRALAAAEREQFSIAILGADLAEGPRHDLLDRLPRISVHTACIVILRKGSWSEVERAARSQAVAILCVESSAQELWDAIESVQRGNPYCAETPPTQIGSEIARLIIRDCGGVDRLWDGYRRATVKANGAAPDPIPAVRFGRMG